MKIGCIIRPGPVRSSSATRTGCPSAPRSTQLRTPGSGLDPMSDSISVDGERFFGEGPYRLLRGVQELGSLHASTQRRAGARLQELQNLTSVAEIQGAVRFVQYNELGLAHQRAGQ